MSPGNRIFLAGTASYIEDSITNSPIRMVKAIKDNLAKIEKGGVTLFVNFFKEIDILKIYLKLINNNGKKWSVFKIVSSPEYNFKMFLQKITILLLYESLHLYLFF